jgi:hypothetical protein
MNKMKVIPRIRRIPVDMGKVFSDRGMPIDGNSEIQTGMGRNFPKETEFLESFSDP